MLAKQVNLFLFIDATIQESHKIDINLCLVKNQAIIIITVYGIKLQVSDILVFKRPIQLHAIIIPANSHIVIENIEK